MTKSTLLRQQLIQNTIIRSSNVTNDITHAVWPPLTTQLVSFIGEGGFNALYARSMYLTHEVFPWLLAADMPGSAAVRLNHLKMSLQAQSAEEANKASHFLLLTFTNILASLIGEPLTLALLSSAWDDGANGEAGIVEQRSF